MTEDIHLDEAAGELPVHELLEAIETTMSRMGYVFDKVEYAQSRATAESVGRFPEPLQYSDLPKRSKEALDALVKYVKKNGKFPDNLMRVILRPIFSEWSVLSRPNIVPVVNNVLDILRECLDLNEVSQMIEGSRARVQICAGDELKTPVVDFGKVKVLKYLKKAGQMVNLCHELKKDPKFNKTTRDIHVDIGEKNVLPTMENWSCITVSVNDTEGESQHFVKDATPLGVKMAECIYELEEYIARIQAHGEEYFTIELPAHVIRASEPDFPVTPMQYVERCLETIDALKKNKKLRTMFAREHMTVIVRFYANRHFGRVADDEIHWGCEDTWIDEGSGVCHRELTISPGFNLSVKEILARIPACIQEAARRAVKR